MAQWELARGQEVFIELDGRRVAGVREYRAQTVRKLHKVEAFGEEKPVALLPGEIRYRIELKKIAPFQEEGSFQQLEDFYLVITGKGKRVVYSGCRWEQLEEWCEAGTPAIVEKAVLWAENRTEDMEGV